MAWKVSFGGDKEVAFDDLSPEDFVEAANGTSESWWSVYKFPASNPAASAAWAVRANDGRSAPRTERP